MLKLKINKDPYWLELGYGVKVKVKPCNSAVFYEAKAYMNAKFEADEDRAAPLAESKIDELFSNFWAVAENFRNQYCGLQELLEAEKTSSRPSQMALRQRAKLLRRMLRVKSALSVPQVPIYRNNLKNRCRLSGLGGFVKAS